MKTSPLVLCLIGLGVVSVLYVRPIERYLRELNYENAARRNTSFICYAVEKRMVSIEEVCSKPLTSIPALEEHFRLVRSRDGSWFQKHGWLYYPEVTCPDRDGQTKKNEIYMTFMGKSFRCSGGKAIAAKL